MGDAGTVLDRQTLYELVGSKPTAYLAQEYGISDVALGKMCRMNALRSSINKERHCVGGT